MKKFILFLFLYACCSLAIHAQEEVDYLDEEKESTPIKYPMFGGIAFQTLVPISTFGEKMNQPGFGGQLEFLVNLNQTPFYAGFAASIANFGNEVYDFTDAEGFDLKWKTNSSLFSSHLLLHLEPKMTLPFQPYFRGQLGFNHFFTASRLVDPESDDNPLERFVDDNSWGVSYGGSVGFLIPLDKDWLYMLDIKGTYLRGSRSSYYSKLSNVAVMEDSIEAFELQESVVDMIGISVGVLIFIE